MTRRWLEGTRPFLLCVAQTGADGRASFVFEHPFTHSPHITLTLKFAPAKGCCASLVGEPTTTGCTVEVTKAGDPAPGVTVEVLAQLLD